MVDEDEVAESHEVSLSYFQQSPSQNGEMGVEQLCLIEQSTYLVSLEHSTYQVAIERSIYQGIGL